MSEVETAVARLATIVAEHRNTGIKGRSWDDAEGYRATCSCGWSENYAGRSDHGIGLWREHLSREIHQEVDRFRAHVAAGTAAPILVAVSRWVKAENGKWHRRTKAHDAHDELLEAVTQASIGEPSEIKPLFDPTEPIGVYRKHYGTTS